MPKKQAAKKPQAPARVRRQTSPSEDLRAAIRRLAPSAFDGNRLNVSKLAALAGGDVLAGEGESVGGNRYRFDWAGRADAVGALHQMPPLTLVPDKRGSVGFDSARNLFLEGDNLEVMKLLRRAYAGKVKMVYIDPPYNTGNDFVYKDNYRDPYREYLRKNGITDGNGGARTSAVKEDRGLNGNRHSGWLSMMFPRLSVARDLMRNDGVIFVSIDDNEFHHLRLLMNVVFGEENFVATLVWRKKSGGGMDSEYFAREHEYILCYRKTETFQLNVRKTDINPRDFNKTKGGRKCKHVKLEKWGANAYRTDRPTMYYAIKDPDGNDFYPQAPDGKDGNWRTRPLALDEAHIHWEKRKGRWTPYEVQYFDESEDAAKVLKDRTILYDLATTADSAEEQKAVFGNKMLDNSKPLDLLIRLIGISGGEDSLVLDFFAGSGTTAQAVMQLNAEDGGKRRFILVQLPEQTPDKSDARAAGYQTIADIAKERIRRAGKKITESAGLYAKETDINFRVFRLQETALPIYTPPQADEKSEDATMSAWIAAMKKKERMKITADDDALITEILLAEGYPLDATMEKITVTDTKTGREVPVYRVTAQIGGEAQNLYVCLDKRVYSDITWDLGMRDCRELFVCRESAIPDATTGNNIITHAMVKTI